MTAQWPQTVHSTVLTTLLVLVSLALLRPAVVHGQADGPAEYTMMFRGVPLDDALERVVETTQIDLVYDSDLVTGQTVYCTAQNAQPSNLLHCLLTETPLDFYQTSGGTYVLTESPRTPPKTGDLTGVVVDAHTGEPLPHAHVLLASANTGVASSRTGHFTLPDLTSGTYRVVATHLGYRPSIDSIRVPPDDEVQRRITLTPSSIASDPVIVDGVERHAPSDEVGARTLSADDLKTLGSAGAVDATAQMGNLLGVNRQRPIADLHLQGGAAGEHEVRLDGIPIRNPVTLRRLLGAFSPLALDRLTVHKAGFGVEYGSTISGVVSAEHALSANAPAYGQVSVDPLSVNAEGHGSIALDDRRSAQFRVAGRSSVWDLYQDPTLHRLLLDWNVVDPMLLSSYFGAEDAPSIQPAAQTASTGFLDVHGAARIDLTPYHVLSVSGYHGQNHLRTQFVTRDPFGMLTQDRYRWENTAGQAQLDWILGARTSASLQARGSVHRVRRGYQMTYGSPDPTADLSTVVDTLQKALDASLWPDDRNEIREWALEATASYAATTRHHLKVGVEVSRLDSRFRLGGRFLRPLSVHATRWQVGGYVRDAISLGTHTSVTAGTRLTYIPARPSVYAEPRLSLHTEGTLGPVGPYALRLAGGLHRQYVNRFEASSTSPTAILPSMRFWLPTGPTHAPPRAVHTSAQLHIQPHDTWTVRGEAFYKHYGRLLALDYTELRRGAQPSLVDSAAVPPSAAIAATNGYALGGGLALTRDGPVLRSTLRYDWKRSRRRFPGRYQGRRIPTPWTEPHQLSLTLGMPVIENLRVRLRSEYGWGRSWGFRQTYYDYLGSASWSALPDHVSLDEPGTHTLDARTRVDVGAQYTLAWKDAMIETKIDLLNALDQRPAFDWGVRSTDTGMRRTTRRLPGRRLVGSISIRY